MSAKKTTDLTSKTVAVLATDGFEQSELLEPFEALVHAGATVHIVSPESGSIRGWTDGDWGTTVKVDRTIADAHVGDYDALVLPGGVMNPDALRTNEDAQRFVRGFFETGKPVSAICHGPQILIDCDVVSGRTMTSYASIRRDLENAGATWTDKEVVVDQGLTTSRTPKDLPVFIAKTIEEVAEGKHEGQMASVN